MLMLHSNTDAEAGLGMYRKMSFPKYMAVIITAIKNTLMV